MPISSPDARTFLSIEVMTAGDARGRVFTFPIPTYNISEDFDWDAQPAASSQVASLASGAFLTEARNIVLIKFPRAGSIPKVRRLL